ncbi:MAG TPA: peptidoglycan DD-metalloendopeptidase family protein, partial [Gemmatimonadaceae bacterium]|nr:peptidoglycan DD-metalloendopeptidase family protein [Gemmatimonadaceae bacterium]
RDTLDRIRRERQELEQRAVDLQNTVHDLGDEVSNLDRQADATARIVKALDAQLATINDEVADASVKQARAESELEVKRTALRRRLIDIYKRGPLFATEAMLSAHSFGELVARYKYLHLLTLRDRGLVTRVEQLRDQVAREHRRLVSLQDALEENRTDKQSEEQRLRSLESIREATLAQTRRQAQVTEAQLARLKATETQLANAISALETERRRAEVAHPSEAHVGSSIRATDYGRMDWPVDGPMIYTFGKAQTASNTTIRWNGDGIKAPVNTAVHAIAAGKVVSVRQLGTYGLTVIIDHGGGDYSIYGSLSRADVREQQVVAKGDVIGGVGISDPDLPPHLHFEIRHGGPAVDPASWMK